MEGYEFSTVKQKLEWIHLMLGIYDSERTIYLFKQIKKQYLQLCGILPKK